VHAAGIIRAAGKTQVFTGGSFPGGAWLLHPIKIVRENSASSAFSIAIPENHDGFSYHRKESGFAQRLAVNNIMEDEPGESIPEVSFVACDSAVCGWLRSGGAGSQ
jgi:hypothetical protein